jgi:hypothetical protein
VTSCTSSKSNSYFDNSFATVISEPAIYRLHTFHAGMACPLVADGRDDLQLVEVKLQPTVRRTVRLCVRHASGTGGQLRIY